MASLQAGVDGFFTKDCTAEELKAAIRIVDGGQVLQSDISGSRSV